jgi:hypothetical protein
MKSKAAIQIESGGRLVIEEIDIPDPGPNQVTVRNFACIRRRSGLASRWLYSALEASVCRRLAPLLLLALIRLSRWTWSTVS